MAITLKDVNNIISIAIKYYVNFSSGQKLPGMNRPLSSEELVALSYYQSVVQYLASKGELADGSRFNIEFLSEDSVPAIDDYE